MSEDLPTGSSGTALASTTSTTLQPNTDYQATAATSTTPTTPIAGATSGTQTSTTSAPPTSTSAPHRYAPVAGRYHYDLSGTTETSGILGGRRSLPSASTDEISVTQTNGGTRIAIITQHEGQTSRHEMTVDVSGDDVRLVSLAEHGDGLSYTVVPQPPALIARVPYEVGDRWEIAWTDDSTGISAAGTGQVLRREQITTPAGTFETIAITITQRLRGLVNGTIDLTIWIQPTTGRQAKQHLITELSSTASAQRTEATRTLRSYPT